VCACQPASAISGCSQSASSPSPLSHLLWPSPSTTSSSSSREAAVSKLGRRAKTRVGDAGPRGKRRRRYQRRLREVGNVHTRRRRDGYRVPSESSLTFPNEMRSSLAEAHFTTEKGRASAATESAPLIFSRGLMKKGRRWYNEGIFLSPAAAAAAVSSSRRCFHGSDFLPLPRPKRVGEREERSVLQGLEND